MDCQFCGAECQLSFSDNASTMQEFAAITWSGGTNAIIGTCDTSGVTIIPVLSVSGGTGTVTDFAITTAGEGPEVVCANNFKDATSGARSLPVNSDNVYFQDIAVDLKYNLEALSAVTVTALHIKASYTGEIGLPAINTDLTTDYNEYRPRFFKLGATSVYIGEGGGDGSGRIMLNFGTVQTAVLVVSADHATGILLGWGSGCTVGHVATIPRLASHDHKALIRPRRSLMVLGASSLI